MSSESEVTQAAGGGTAVLIAGMHRAGTSMVAKALGLAGLNLGDDNAFVPPAPDNPGGFFEHAGFVHLDDDLLAATGGAWDHPPVAPPMAADDPRVAHLRERAVELTQELGVAASWGWKDPRASLTIRFWLDVIPDLRVVICLRHPLEVALSLKRRNRASYAHSLSLWHSYYEFVLEAAPAERRIVTHYDAYFSDRDAEAARLLGFARLPEEATAEAAGALEVERRHHVLEIGLREAGLDPTTIELYERLRAEAGDPVAPAEPGELPAGPARIDQNALDLLIAKEQLKRRERQVGSLERQRGELEGRVDELESAGRAEVLGKIGERLARLEEKLLEMRYAQELAPRGDAGELRACRRLVRAHVPRGSSEVLMIAKDDPALLDLYDRPTGNFPRDASGRYPGFALASGVAAIGHLEAQRLRGSGFLLVPKAAAWWLERFGEFGAHLSGSYELLASEPGAGSLFDLRARRSAPGAFPRALPAAIDRLAARCGRDPAVLDCTGLGLSEQMPKRHPFSPPPGETLPYRDGTIDVVLVLDGAGEHDRAAALEEARRVAATAVLHVEATETPIVSQVEWISAPAAEPGGPIRFVVAGTEPSSDWLAHLSEALADEPDCEVALASDGLADVLEGAELVAVVEEGVLPLPGCCAAARATFSEHEGAGAVAVKLIDAHGALAAAGTTVFNDGSWAPVAAGSYEVSAPWHEFVRAVSGGDGLMFFATEAVESAETDLLRLPLTGLAGSVWAQGSQVLYQPDAAAVRARPGHERGESRQGANGVSSAWATLLSDRPERPPSLDEPSWRRLLARDEPAAAARALAP